MNATEEISWTEKIKNEVSLASVDLASQATFAIKLWWQGEISGNECIKVVASTTIIEAAAKVGGAVGFYTGSFVSSDWGEIGRSIGRKIAKTVVEYILNFLRKWLFGISKDEAVSNAYRYLGVKENASKAEINTAFRKLALKHHPDRGGSVKDYYILQCNMALIKEVRGGGIFDLAVDIFNILTTDMWNL